MLYFYKCFNRIIGNFPNTYSYSKALAEQLVLNERGIIPLAIVRPTIVTPALMEPLPGWVENLNGPTGNIAGVGKGFIRVSKIDKHLVTDIIPVDYPINLMIAVGWYTASRKPKDIVVYTCGTGHQNPITWADLNKWGMKAWINYPTKEMIWYPSSYFTSSDILFKINATLFHQIPGYFWDLVYIIIGKKARMVTILQYFSNHIYIIMILKTDWFVRESESSLCLFGIFYSPSVAVHQQQSVPFDGKDVF